MDALLNIEKKLGRTRKEKWGPRTIDLDILFFDDEITDIADLKIPHPEIMNRPFILKLMTELSPEFMSKLLKRLNSKKNNLNE